MADQQAITILKKVVEILEAETAAGGALSEVEMVDYGAILPPSPSNKMPALFCTIRASRHPSMRAASGGAGGHAEEGYDNEYTIVTTIYTYVTIKNNKDSFEQAANLLIKVLRILHENYDLDALAVDTQPAEEEDCAWGVVDWPWGLSDSVVYGIEIPMRVICRSLSS